MNATLLAQQKKTYRNKLELRVEFMSINELNNHNYLNTNSVNSLKVNWRVLIENKYFFGIYGLIGGSSIDKNNFNDFVNYSFVGESANGYRENVELSSQLNHTGFNIELGLPVGYNIRLSDKLNLELSAGFYFNSWTPTIESSRNKNAFVKYSSGGATEEEYILNQIGANGFGFFTGVDLSLVSSENTRINFGLGYSMFDKTWYANHRLGTDIVENEYKVLLDLLRVRLGVSILSETDDFF
jgi:hypothetical protein